ncbi:MAG: hypothetical protein E7242_07500 [Lachnospiraceae bacterium]|nr:hypothetical protein [Lachnospiraceae bacterium]
MLIYDKAYTEMKNKYLIPLSSYSVPYSRLRSNNIKNLILNKSTSVEKLAESKYLFRFDEEYLYKALLADIELFYIRKVLQKADSEFCKGDGISANWNIVTNYYNAFFAASLMLRLCHRGNFFFDNTLKKQLDFLVSNITGFVVRLESKQFYEVYEDKGQKVLTLTGTSEGTHELVWRKMDVLINEMLMLSRFDSEEYLVLAAIKQINSSLKNTYPSQLRNRVNYQTDYGLDCVDRKIFQLNESIDWVRYLLGFTKTSDDNQIACYMYAYTKYIEFFCSNFIAEYYEIRGVDNGILKNINSNRSNKIEKEKAVFVI